MYRTLYYQPYTGGEPYLFLRYDRSDRKAASEIINNLIERQFRTCYSEYSAKVVSDSEWLANRILSSGLAVFLISSASLNSLNFRNCINYALSQKKKVFCIYLDDEKPGYGFDMQLANVPGAKASQYENAAALCDEIVKSGLFLQDMRSEDAKIPIQRNRARTAATVSIVAILALFAIAVPMAIVRIEYVNSVAGQLEKLTQTDYLDLSAQKASTIELLPGKTIHVLVARNMGLTDIEALARVNCEELDLSGNPNVESLEPLLEIKNLKTVKVTQDMRASIAQLHGRYPFKIVIMG